MQYSPTLETTWIRKFLSEWSNLAIAHKLGWDNMSLAKENMRVAEILWEEWIAQNFSVSAFRSSKLEFNTTSKLIAAGESQNQQIIIETLQEISDFHTQLLEDILSWCDDTIRKQLIAYAKDLFAQYKSDSLESDIEACQKSSDYILWVWEKTFSLLWIGEVIAAKVFVQYLQKHGIPAVYVDTPSLQDIHPKKLSERVWDFLQWEFQKIYSGCSDAIPVMPWYIWGIQGWILSRLDRWYTDYTWERAAVSLHDCEMYDEVLFYIQKMYGFKSTDPRWLDDEKQAKSVNNLSYSLAQRAISHRWANAWLINSHALSPHITRKKIGILVWNPTDTSDIAYISKHWNPKAKSVELVLGRSYNSPYDDRTYSRLNHYSQGNHIVYLMWDNIEDVWAVFEQANATLKRAWVKYTAWELRMVWNPELSYVFDTAQDAQDAQKVLHAEFIENS